MKLNFWTLLVCNLFLVENVFAKGIDIGYKCQMDSECRDGNGGRFSTCNKWFGVCTCTINADHVGLTFQQDREFFDCPNTSKCNQSEIGSCKDCIPRDSLKFEDERDWYGPITNPLFGVQFIYDAPSRSCTIVCFNNSGTYAAEYEMTAVCYEPERAKKTIPNEFVHLKESPIAGLGIFASKTLPIGAVFGPFKGFKPSSMNIPEQNGKLYAWLLSEEKKFNVSAADWIDALDIARSNYLRYLNTPSKEEQENVYKTQYKGEIYYVTIRIVHRGEELTVWYGNVYGKLLGITRQVPYEVGSAVGNVNSLCYDESGEDCVYDRNAVCIKPICICKPGTNIRAGKCLYDETLGGKCSGYDGAACKNDSNAVCMRGFCECKGGYKELYSKCSPETLVNQEPLTESAKPEHSVCKGQQCVCKDFASKENNTKAKDETVVGKCKGADGDDCKIDSNAECINKVCVCKKGSSVVNGTCKQDETLGGRCVLKNYYCRKVTNSVCEDGFCKCLSGTTAVKGECFLDEAAGGKCVGKDGSQCLLDQHAVCRYGTCRCKKNATQLGGRCVPHESYGGRCEGRNGDECALDSNAECIKGRCECKFGSSPLGDKCIKYETSGGKCAGSNGTVCVLDSLALCINGKCKCDDSINASDVSGVCRIKETYGGMCSSYQAKSCILDKNAECIKMKCECKRGTYPVAGKCMKNETVGGTCSSSNGKLCKLDMNAKCQDGLCICKASASNINGICVLDETKGGVCTGSSGESCKLDANAVCINRTCTCKKGTSEINGRCILDESFGGKCKGEDRTPCLHGSNIVCQKRRCVYRKLNGTICSQGDSACSHNIQKKLKDEQCTCKPGSSLIAGKCVQDEVLHGRCYGVEGATCDKDSNAECERGYCVCKRNATAVNGICYKDEAFGGRCSGDDGSNCIVDTNAECVGGLCVCKYRYMFLPEHGSCVKVGVLGGYCDQKVGCKFDENADCIDSRCVCKRSARPYNTRCVHDDTLNGNCRGKEGSECLLDRNAVCVNSVCQCKPDAVDVDGKCTYDVKDKLSCDASKISACEPSHNNQEDIGLDRFR